MMECSPRCKKVYDVVRSVGLPQYRATQVVQHVYKGRTTSFLDMKNISLRLRVELDQSFGGSFLSLQQDSVARAPNAEKILFRCADGNTIESVYLDFGSHKSLCISSQAGCAFACRFCATGKIGFKRHLTVDEITDQVLVHRKTGKPVDSISFMGMGEPLGNPRFFDSLHLLTDRNFLAFPQRSISVSTVGIIPALQKLTKLYPQVNVAFSLHSPFEDERNSLVPANKTYPFQEVLDLLDDRILRTGRRTWIAYLLLQGLNDSSTHARELAHLIESRPVKTRHLYHINLISYNNGKFRLLRLDDMKHVNVWQKDFAALLCQQKMSTASFNESMIDER